MSRFCQVGLFYRSGWITHNSTPPGALSRGHPSGHRAPDPASPGGTFTPFSPVTSPIAHSSATERRTRTHASKHTRWHAEGRAHLVHAVGCPTPELCWPRSTYVGVVLHGRTTTHESHSQTVRPARTNVRRRGYVTRNKFMHTTPDLSHQVP